jgi:hypothetical protein
MSADDINVLITDSDLGSLQNKIDRVMAELETWFTRNKLVINAGKISVMSFHKTNILVETSSHFKQNELGLYS